MLLLPEGLRGHERLASRVTTWDMTGDQILQRALNAIQMGTQALEIKGVDGDNYIVPATPIDKLMKTDITSSTTGAENALFGATAIIQLSQCQTAFGALPKRGYPRQGFRAAYAAAIASGAGVAEAANVGTAVVPTYLEITVGLKEVEVVTGMTSRMEVMVTKNDNIEFEGNAQVVFSNFMEALDTDMLVDMDTLAGNNLESLDRVCGSSGENTALSYTANDEDLYSVDRSTYTWFNGNSDHNSGTDRAISKSLVDALMAAQIDRWGGDMDNKLYLGNTDTWTEWSAVEGARQRFGEDTFTVNINGIQTFKGNLGGYKLTTYDGIPFLWDVNVSSDGIGRLMLLDLNHTGIVIGRELEWIESNDPYVVGHNHRGLWYGIMEVWCDLPSADGKLRDLTTA